MTLVLDWSLGLLFLFGRVFQPPKETGSRYLLMLCNTNGLPSPDSWGRQSEATDMPIRQGHPRGEVAEVGIEKKTYPRE